MSFIENIVNKFFIKSYQPFWIILTLLIFILPILIFGVVYREEYPLGFFSTHLLKNFSNFFIEFQDIYGPGSGFPLGNAFNFYPINWIIKDNKIFVIVFVTLNLYFQINFIKKNLKLYGIYYKDNFIIPFVVFSFPNIVFLHAADYYGAFHTYSLFFPLFYYYKKFCYINNFDSCAKFLIVFFFWIANGSIQLSFLFIIFLVFDFFSLKKNYNLFFKLRNYFVMIIVIFFTYDFVYFIYLESFKATTIDRVNFGAVSIGEIMSSILYPWIREFKDIKRLPFLGIVVPISIICSCLYLYKFKRFFNKQIKNIAIINLIFFLLLFTNLNENLKIFSAVASFGIIVTFTSYLIFFYYFQNFKFSLKIIIAIFFLCQTAFTFNKILFEPSYNTKLGNHSITNLYKKFESNFENVFKKMKNNNLSKIERIYFSSNLFNSIYFGKFSSWGLYSITDLVNFELIPFNGRFKNFHFGDFGFDNNKLHGQLPGDTDGIKHQLFLNIYRIKYILTEENLKADLINNTLEEYDQIIFDNKKKDSQIINVYINTPLFYEIPINFFNSYSSNFSESCKKKIYECIQNNNFLFKETKKVKIERIKLNNFKIENLDNSIKYFVFPYKWSDKWVSKNKSVHFYNFKNVLTIIKLPPNKKIYIEYNNTKKIFTRTIYIILIVIFLLFIFYNRYKNDN